MQIPWTINILPGAGGTQFHPATVTVGVGDQIHWANTDMIQAHWPGLMYNGQLNRTFFMPHEIAPDSSSVNWTPAGPGTYTYECSLHPSERGTIVVQ